VYPARLNRPFRQLERLEICGGGVSDEGVKELMWLTGLQHLSLAQNSRITDRASLFLSGLLQIRDLNLTGTQLTGNGILPLRSLTVRAPSLLQRCRSFQETPSLADSGAMSISSRH
jgi:hypothetical protein